jgi:hypothetical protein
LTLDLERRAGWPAELRTLLDRYPREAWEGHANLGEVARFWLARHAAFRRLGAALAAATREFREDRLGAHAFRRFFAPRLQLFLESLEGHHQVEDLHYFPVFRAAEPRLAKGFDVLERDHGAIHSDIVAAGESAAALLRALDDESARRAATDAYAAANGRLLDRLLRHLDDEEDLIVPVILDQGERRLFRG